MIDERDRVPLRATTRPIRRELEQQMREAAEDERFEDAARYRNRLFAIERLAERQAVEREVVGDDRRDRHRRRRRPRGGAGLPAARRPDGRPLRRSTSRTSTGEDVGEVLEAFCLEYYGSAPSIPPQILVPREVGRHRRARGVPVRAARLARRGARARARREAAPAGARAAERAARARVRDVRRGDEAAAARRGARGAARGAEPRVPADPDRVLRHLEHPGPGDRSARWSSSRTRVAKKAHYRKFAVRGLDGQDDFAAMARGDRAPVRAARADAGVGRVRRVVRGGAEPRRHRRRQGPALGRARGDAGARPAARRRDLAREADRGGVRARPRRPDRARPHSPGLQLLQRIRDEAHRFAISFHRQRRDAAARESIFDQLEGVGPARRRALLRHFGSAERVAGGVAGGARGRARRAGEDGAPIYAQLHRPAARDALVTALSGGVRADRRLR